MDILSDLRSSLRELRKRPTFTATAILSLSLGIGATTAVFSVIYAVLINPYPYRDANRLTIIRLVEPQGTERETGYAGPQITQFRQLKSFESVIALQSANPTTTDGDLPEDVRCLLVQPDYPNHFGVPPMMGRWLIPSDAPPGQEPAPIVVLSYQFWQRYFLGDPHVLGRTIRLDRVLYQVVGVMPPRFTWAASDVFRPAKVTQDPNGGFAVSLRLRKDVTLAQANAELQPLIEHFAQERSAYFPEKFRVSLVGMIDAWKVELGPTLYLLLGAVASLLLIGCGNVSILLLARGIERQHELAVRAAVGAARSRILRQLLTESLVIAVVGRRDRFVHCVARSRINPQFPAGIFHPRRINVRINIPVLLFSVALACASTIISGLWPALQISRPNLVPAFAKRHASRLSATSARAARTHAMVAAQVALTVLLLAAAGAAAKGFLHLLHTNLGYDPRSLPLIRDPNSRRISRFLAGSLSISRPTSRAHRRHAAS